MLEELGSLHGHHAVLTRIQAVQVSLGDALRADKPTQLLHLADLLLVRIAVANLTDDIVLLRHHLQSVRHILDIPIELRHILVQVEREERRLQHRLIQYVLWLEIELRPRIGVLHHLIRQLLALFCLGVNPLVVEELAEGVEN